MIAGALIYLGFAFISPVALVAAPLGLLLLLQRPAARDLVLGTALLLWVAWGVAHAAPGFARLEAAWVCILAGGTAVSLSLRRPGRWPLLTGGLLSVAIACAAALPLALASRMSYAEVRWLAARHYGQQARLLFGALAVSLGGGAEPQPLLAAFESTAGTVVDVVSRLLPGLVLLQSVAALAAAWALYRLVSREPAGEGLPRLSEFRFNDHLIWGVVVALAALVLPWGAAWLRPLGGNLAAFFGGLYVARGLGVIVALGAAAGIAGPFAALLGVLATVFLLPLVLLSTLALGITDTWIDWRRLAAKVKKG